MNDITRNRLIGAIVILLVIVIFFPYVGKKKSFQSSNELPLTALSGEWQPGDEDEGLESMAITNQQVDTATEGTVESIKRKQQVRDKQAEEPKIAVKPNPPTQIEKNYIIQLVALKNKQKVEELLALLRLHDYQAYIDLPDQGSDQIMRLYVGPYLSKEQAESIMIDLNNLTKLKGIIVNKKSR